MILLDKIDVRFTFGQTEYARAVQQYLLAGNIVRKRDFFILPLLLILLLAALFYSRFNQWVLFITLLCLAAVLLVCYLFFLKPQRDHQNKPHIYGEVQLSFTEEGMIFPSKNQEIATAGEALTEEAENPGGEADAVITQSEAGVQATGESYSAPQEMPENQNGAETTAIPSEPEERTEGRKGLLAQRRKLQRKKDKENVVTAKKKPSAMLNWDSFAEAWENREFFFLIQQPHLYYIVPKRSFTDQEELQYFLKMLYRRVGIVESVAPYR